MKKGKKDKEADLVATVMIREAQELHLDEKYTKLIKAYKQVEHEIYYTPQFQKQQFPVLSLDEEALFISPLEENMEKIFEHELKVDFPDQSISNRENEEDDYEDQYDDYYDDYYGEEGDYEQENIQQHENQNNFNQTQQLESEEELDDEELQNVKTQLNVFIPKRDPRGLHLQVQPLAMYSMWIDNLKQQFPCKLEVPQSQSKSRDSKRK